MSIRDLWEKIKPSTDTIHFNEKGEVERLPWLKKFYLSLLIILVGTLSFGLGRLSGTGQGSAIKIEYDPSLSALQTGNKQVTSDNLQFNHTAAAVKGVQTGAVYASNKGTKYHYSHCSGAKQISEKNKVTFASPSAAEAAGYTLAANCSPR